MKNHFFFSYAGNKREEVEHIYNLLDLNNDVLNIIGDYVKKDNFEREEKERAFKFVNNELKYLKKDKSMKYIILLPHHRRGRGNNQYHLA